MSGRAVGAGAPCRIVRPVLASVHSAGMVLRVHAMHPASCGGLSVGPVLRLCCQNTACCRLQHCSSATCQTHSGTWHWQEQAPCARQSVAATATTHAALKPLWAESHLCTVRSWFNCCCAGTWHYGKVLHAAERCTNIRWPCVATCMEHCLSSGVHQ